MARKQADIEAPAVTKTDAVKAAIAEGIELPEDGVKFIKDRFGLDITKPQFSTYKSIAKKRSGATRRGSKSAREGQLGGNGNSTDAAALARDVKRLVQVYGAEAVSDMAKVFAD